jgi:G:T-mismatch repair DNA endonuclease (very short patch repair protein)
MKICRISEKKGKTFEEMYSKEKADEIRKKIILRSLDKTYEEIYGIEKAAKIKGSISFSNTGKKRTEEANKKNSLRKKGKSYEELYGVEKAKELKEEKRLFRLGKPSYMLNKHHKDETIQKIRESMLKKGKELGEKRKSFIKNHPDSILKMHKALENIKITKPEQLLLDCIQKNNLPYKYTGDRSFWITIEGTHINPDFVNTNCKKEFIEVQGCYFHGCKECNITSKNTEEYVEQDKKRQELLKQYGYNVIYIWEHEILNNNFIDKLIGRKI